MSLPCLGIEGEVHPFPERGALCHQESGPSRSGSWPRRSSQAPVAASDEAACQWLEDAIEDSLLIDDEDEAFDTFITGAREAADLAESPDLATQLTGFATDFAVAGDDDADSDALFGAAINMLKISEACTEAGVSMPLSDGYVEVMDLEDFTIEELEELMELSALFDDENLED